MPPTKHCGICTRVKGADEDCRCFCHASKQDLEFEEPESQWNTSSDAVVVELMDSQPSE